MLNTKITQIIESIAVRSRFIFRAFARYYTRMINNEINLAEITHRDKILCIGGGICPFSAIALHLNTGAAVTVIDHNLNCVKKARRFVNRLGLSDKIRLLHCDGRLCENLDLTRFSVIHIALQVTPQEDVLQRVLQAASAGTRVLVRRSKREGAANCRLLGVFCEDCRPIAHGAFCNVGNTVMIITKNADKTTHKETAA